MGRVFFSRYRAPWPGIRQEPGRWAACPSAPCGCTLLSACAPTESSQTWTWILHLLPGWFVKNWLKLRGKKKNQLVVLQKYMIKDIRTWYLAIEIVPVRSFWVRLTYGQDKWRLCSCSSFPNSAVLMCSGTMQSKITAPNSSTALHLVPQLLGYLIKSSSLF